MTILVPVDLRCPSCGAPLSTDDVNVARGVAVCRPCDAVYALGDPAEDVDAGDLEIPLPSTLDLVDERDRLVIKHKWDRAQGLALAGFFAVWDAFLVFWYSIAVFATDGVDLMMVLFPLLHVAAGVGGTWSALAYLFNTTRIEARARVVQTTPGPIPAPWRSVTHDIGETVQFFVDRPQNWFVVNNGNRSKQTFRVCAFQRDATVVPIVKGIDSLSEARTIERLLERHYGMRDLPLRGEVPRDEVDAAGPEVAPTTPVGSGSLALVNASDGGQLGLADQEKGAISLSPVGSSRRLKE